MNKDRWQPLVGFPYDPKSITLNAPPFSGVYALFAFGVCVYVGESDDICAGILEVCTRAKPCLKEKHVTHFTFELVPPETRARRQRDRIRALRPGCNLRTGSPDCSHCSLAQEHDPTGVLEFR
jgi:hypothetical protein